MLLTTLVLPATACLTVARHCLPTSLQAIDPMGREIALRRGSNVLMPILTPTKCGGVQEPCWGHQQGLRVHGAGLGTSGGSGCRVQG